MLLLLVGQAEEAAIECRGESIRVRNAALEMVWQAGKNGPRLISVADRIGGHPLGLHGELFRVILTDGREYAAGDLVAAGRPRVVAVAGNSRASRQAERLPRRQVQLPLRSADGQLAVQWRAVTHDDANYIRQELTLSVATDCQLDEIRWLDEPLPGARNAGSVDGCPVQAGPFFLGIEDPHALNRVGSGPVQSSEHDQAAESGARRVTCRTPRHTHWAAGEPIVQGFVWGVAAEGQMRRAFLRYIEQERAHPYRPFLHYNSWYDIAWAPFALNETNCLEAIRLIGERFIRRHQVTMDALVFDDGWDDPHTLWRFHAGFPHGFAPLAELAAHYDTHLGVWLSPFGGYGRSKQARLRYGREQGYETNRTGFSLAGPRYYAAFKAACVRMIREYGVNHFKFDGIAAGMAAAGGGDYLRDTEAMRRLMLELRREAPDLYINLTTGSWPSPFWLRYADSLWRQGHDMGFCGKGSKQQQWITYRDREVYRNIVRRSPLYPLNALMTQGVAWSRHGPAGDPAFNSDGFRDDVRAFFGSGTSLQELYIQPGRLSESDWAVLAEAAKWSRANADILRDTHWIGGDPGELEVYGYASWSPRRGILMLRNPAERSRAFELELGRAFELPADGPKAYRLRSPWAEDAGEAPSLCRAGRPHTLNLAPFEVRVLEAIPVR